MQANGEPLGRVKNEFKKGLRGDISGPAGAGRMGRGVCAGSDDPNGRASQRHTPMDRANARNRAAIRVRAAVRARDRASSPAVQLTEIPRERHGNVGDEM